MTTGISDHPTYRTFCSQAAIYPEVFQSFRRNELYCGVFESVNQEQGQDMIECIDRDNPALWNHLTAFKTSEQVGYPNVSGYPKIGVICPTTLRYIKILSDLIKHFTSLDKFKIAEIGVGYGGQCKIIHDVFHPAEYTLIDLPEPLALTKKFLSEFSVPNLKFKTQEELVPETYDLVISNYAFSECTIPVQEAYINLVIAGSARGYMLYNFITHLWRFENIPFDKIRSLKPGMLMLNDESDTKPVSVRDPNKLLIWK
jgi:hypothetical protein